MFLQRALSLLLAAALTVEPVLAQVEAVPVEQPVSDAAAVLLDATAASPKTQEEALTPPSADEPGFEAYQPRDKDERGLWMQMDEAERKLKVSPTVIRDPQLNAYVHDVLCRTVGQRECKGVRIYLIRTPQFNATMAPNGVMEVWSGLLLRVRNEAQLAAILGHEYTHYRNQHSLQLFRQIKDKTNAAAWLSFVPFGFVASLGLLSSIFSFSREMEREADEGGLGLIANAGYDTREAALIWEQLRAEMDATAEARKTKSRKDKNGGMFGTHPPSLERVQSLRKAAEGMPGERGATGEAEYRAALARNWPEFVEDQLKMNDFGASDYLLTSLGSSGWTPELLYARGELYRRKATPEALAEAESFYSGGINGGGSIAELWRGRGLARLKLGNDEGAKADLKEYVARAPDAGDKAMMTMLAGG